MRSVCGESAVWDWTAEAFYSALSGVLSEGLFVVEVVLVLCGRRRRRFGFLRRSIFLPPANCMR